MVGGHGTGRDEDRDGRKRAEESFRSIPSTRGGTRYEARAVQEKVTAAAGRRRSAIRKEKNPSATRKKNKGM